MEHFGSSLLAAMGAAGTFSFVFGMFAWVEDRVSKEALVSIAHWLHTTSENMPSEVFIPPSKQADVDIPNQPEHFCSRHIKHFTLRTLRQC
jgi:hypothetical protein